MNTLNDLVNRVQKLNNKAAAVSLNKNDEALSGIWDHIAGYHDFQCTPSLQSVGGNAWIGAMRNALWAALPDIEIDYHDDYQGAHVIFRTFPELGTRGLEVESIIQDARNTAEAAAIAAVKAEIEELSQVAE